MLNNVTITPLTLYQQVKDLLKEEINKGSFSKGLPSEQELGKQLNVSRVTIRKAIQELRREGLVRSYRGKGTFVAKSVKPIKTRILKVASYASNPAPEIQQKIYREFEQLTQNVRIEPLFCSDTKDYCNFLIRTMDSQTAPDVVMFSESQFPRLFHQKILRKLDSYLPDNCFSNDYFNRAFEVFKEEGSLFGIPFVISPLALYINKTCFADLGIKNVTFRDWNSLISSACEITGKNSSGTHCYGFLFPYESPNRWPLFLIQNNIQLLKNETRKKTCNLDTKKAIETVEWMLSFKDKYRITPHLHPDVSDLFEEGWGGILVTSLFLLSRFTKTVEFDWEVIPLPSFSEYPRNIILTTGYGITESCSVPELGATFLRYMISPRVQDLIAKENISCPVRKRSTSFLAPQIRNSIHKIVNDEILENSLQILHHPDYHNIMELIQNEMNKIWLNMQSPADGCKNAAMKVNGFLKRSIKNERKTQINS